MLASSIPTKFSIPFANSAGVGFIQNPIPVNSLIGIAAGRASLQDGFPPLTFTPIASGGDPPWGADMNGILFQVTSWSRWFQAGGAGTIGYDSAFSAAIGGYPKGALLQVNATMDRFWQSSVDNNVSNPDTGGANWTPFPDLIVQKQTGNYTATDTGTQNHPHITISPGTAIANLIGAPIRFRIAFANTITNPDIIINGSSAVPMFNSDGSAIVVGQFSAVGTLVTGHLISTSDFRVTSPGKPVTSPPPASPFIPGQIFLWGSEVPPFGTLECNGQNVLISAFPNLFGVIGNRFGGNGTTNFSVPDCRGMFVRGWDHGRGIDVNSGARTNSGNGTTGDHIGTIEAANVGPTTFTGRTKMSNVQGVDYNGFSGLKGIGGTGTNANWSINPPTDGGVVGYIFDGFLTAGEPPLTPGTPSESSVIFADQIFGPTQGFETRPININLMYVICY